MKADVLHAWKMIEARKLALAEAKKYADDANQAAFDAEGDFPESGEPQQEGIEPFLALGQQRPLR